MIPKNLNEFPWGTRHFFKGKGTKPKMSLNKNFIVEAMRLYGLSYKIVEYQIVPLPMKKEPIVAMKVAVRGQRGEEVVEVEGFATVGDKSYEEGQSHFGQQVLNRAIAVGVKNWLQISDADVEEIIKTKLDGGKGIKEMTDDIEPEAPETTPEEQLADDDAAAKLLGLGG